MAFWLFPDILPCSNLCPLVLCITRERLHSATHSWPSRRPEMEQRSSPVEFGHWSTWAVRLQSHTGWGRGVRPMGENKTPQLPRIDSRTIARLLGAPAQERLGSGGRYSRVATGGSERRCCVWPERAIFRSDKTQNTKEEPFAAEIPLLVVAFLCLPASHLVARVSTVPFSLPTARLLRLGARNSGSECLGVRARISLNRHSLGISHDRRSGWVGFTDLVNRH
jgi:hypothetical protein